MNRILGKFGISLHALIVAVTFATLVVIVSATNITRADDGETPKNGHLVTIYDRGSEKSIISQALTIGDAIKEAGIIIDPKDLVEPGLDEKMIASNYKVNIFRARPVIVVDGNSRIKIMTPYQTAPQIAESAGVKLYDEDKANLEQSKDILTDGAGLILTINRATPVNLTLYGKTTIARTHGKTVSEMLAEKGIKLTDNDRVLPSQSTKITENMNIRIWREGNQIITLDEEIDFEIKKIENIDKDISFREIKVPGEKGLRNVSYEITIQDGVEVGRVEIASLTIKQAKEQIESVGAKGQYTTPSENENITWDFLINKGFSRVQVAGIMGNLMQEHRFNTTGDGLAQWTGARKAELYAMPYPNNIYTQLEFLGHELDTNYINVSNEIRLATNITDATIIFQNKFEKCGICMQDNRINYARDILASH